MKPDIPVFSDISEMARRDVVCRNGLRRGESIGPDS